MVNSTVLYKKAGHLFINLRKKKVDIQNTKYQNTIRMYDNQ